MALGSGRGPAWGAKKVGEKVPCRDSHTFFALRHTTNQTSKKASLSGRLFLTLHPYFSLLPNTQQALALLPSAAAQFGCSVTLLGRPDTGLAHEVVVEVGVFVNKHFDQLPLFALRHTTSLFCGTWQRQGPRLGREKGRGKT